MTLDIKKLGKNIFDKATDNAVKTAFRPKSTFDSAINRVVMPMLVKLIEPWVDHCFSTYSEEYFHMKMTTGFDFIDDWKRNHTEKYNKIVKALRVVRNRLDLNEDVILKVVLDSLAKYGWNIEEWEKTRFRSNISRLIAEIYS